MTAPPELNPQRVAFIGFGEAGQAFARGIRKDRPRINLSAYDIKENDSASRSSLLSAYNAENVYRLSDSSEVADAELVFSTVTADNAYEAAQSLNGANLRGSFFFDCNSCSPQTKRKSAKIIEDLGACYIDSAVMAPVHPGLHNTPLLLSGSKAAEGSERLKSLGFGNVSVVDGGVGGASTQKMIRSIMIKGIEAVTVECMLAAGRAGIADETIRSLELSFPGFDWPQKAPYFLERVLTHGQRRAAEMREVSKTLEELGLEPIMSRSAASLQQFVGDMKIDTVGGTDSLEILTDKILTKYEKSGVET